MEIQILKYVDWPDVEHYLLDELKKNPEYTRNEANLWRVWLTLHYDTLTHNSYEYTSFEFDYEDAVNDFGDWVLLLEPIIAKLKEELGGEATIRYYW